MKIFLIVAGIVLILFGGVWFFQGLNVLLGSFMSGQPVWGVIGAAVMTAGAVLLVLGLRLRKPAPKG